MLSIPTNCKAYLLTLPNFTTVMLWEGRLATEYRGHSYGMKSKAFPPYMDLPQQVTGQLELALGSPEAPRAELASKGWAIRNPLEVGRTPWTYQQYIQNSKAEFAIAKHGYVISQPGWFSERSAAYLASGRPVVLQETGFSNWLSPGKGVISFRTPDEAIAGIEEIQRNYRFHCRAAREMASEFFDSRFVLTSLIERVFSTRYNTTYRG